jgi:hypothetical protein
MIMGKPLAGSTCSGGVAPRGVLISHTGRVTTKERLHLLVDELADEQASRALALLEAVTGEQQVAGERRVVPASLGAGVSGRSDISERVDEILAEGFGR